MEPLAAVGGPRVGVRVYASTCGPRLVARGPGELRVLRNNGLNRDYRPGAAGTPPAIRSLIYQEPRGPRVGCRHPLSARRR